VNLVYRPAAASDIEDAYRWYSGKREGLGDEFLEAVHQAAARILEHPEACPVFHRDARRARLIRFPYSLVYRNYPNTVVIVGYFHGRRDPMIWASRLDG